MAKPRLLDLFCGAGGAAMGYHRAGFEVVGVDIEYQSDYPFEFVTAEALGFLTLARMSWKPDAIHASPPCQAYTTLRHRTAGEYPDLVAETRHTLRATGLPYVIENVVGAPLENPVMLCGSSFGLGAADRQLRRHRLFETNFPVIGPLCQHRGHVIGVYGTGGGGQMTRGFKARGAYEAGKAMDIHWMNNLKELSQAIPPAYTEHIGHYLMAELNAKAKTAA